MIGVTVLSRARTQVIIHPTVTIKTWHNPDDSDNEISFYLRYPWAAPKLIHQQPGVLVTETLPVAGNNPGYRPAEQLRDLLLRLNKHHVHHRDVHPANIVEGPQGPLLIDWETAIHHPNPSYDLFGPQLAGIPAPDIHTGCAPMFWYSIDENSIYNQWGADIFNPEG